MNEEIIAEKDGKRVIITYNCIKCGSCCRAGFDVRIRDTELSNWIKLGKEEFIQYIQIDPKSISLEGLGGYHIEIDEEKVSLGVLFQNYSDEEKQDIIYFILNNHIYRGQGEIPLPIYTFIPTMPPRPILIPKNFDIIKQGLERNIVYILKFNLIMCPFLDGNLCSIHEIKPEDCKNFPFDQDGNCIINDFELKICKGMKEIVP
jgi:Fe-S-cluster containining protein